jgi:ferredoxin-type protein NapG
MSGIQVGTPYIYDDDKGCYMCMLCTQVCPTGALDRKSTEPEQTQIGVAQIDETTCLNHLYARDEAAGKTDGTALYCNTCYNSCPLQGKAIYLEDLVIPIITDECTGCGVCVERCPNTPRSIKVIPTGMPGAEKVGARDRGVVNRDELLKEKEEIKRSDDEVIFEYNFDTSNVVKEWE